VIDKLERMKPEHLAEVRSGADGRFAPGVGARIVEVAALRGWPAVAAALATAPGGTEAGAPFHATLDALEAMGLGGFLDVDLTIVRGLAYYTGTVFELFDAGRTLRHAGTSAASPRAGGRPDSPPRSASSSATRSATFSSAPTRSAATDRGAGADPPPGPPACPAGPLPTGQLVVAISRGNQREGSRRGIDVRQAGRRVD
jgi:hypothetical protein